MRRQFSPPSSMELLLDAMCNVFGAVLFMAILIGGVSIAKNLALPEGQVSSEVFAEAQTELNLLEAKLKTTNMECELLRNIPNVAVSPNNIVPDKSLLERCTNQIQTINMQAEKIDMLSAELKDLQQQLQIIQEFSADPQAAETMLLNRRQQLQEQLTTTRAVYLEPSALQYSDRLQPWRILITAEEIFIIGSNQHIRNLRSRDEAVEIKRFDFNGFDWYQLKKQRGHGIALTDFALNEQTLPPAAQQDFFIEILSEPDAISQCALLLKNLRSEHWPYNWRIVSAESVLLSTGTGSLYEMVR